MVRVAYTKVPRYGKGCYPVPPSQDSLACRRFVQGLDFVPCPIVATAQVDYISCHQVTLKPVLSDQGRVVTDEQKTDRATSPLDDGVGSQRGRKGYQIHIIGGGVPVMEHFCHSPPNADGQVVIGGQGFS